MPRTALSLIGRAAQIAKVGNLSPTGQLSGYTTQALDELNDLSDFICQTMDFAGAMGTFFFTLNANLVSIGGNADIVQAAPNKLPLDYLRVQTSGGATGAQRTSKWYLQGVPYDMVEIDLTEWDDQVQQAGMQSYPYFWAKDMSQRAIVANITGNLTTASTAVSNVPTEAFSLGILAGQSIAGGIGGISLITPGTTITNVNAGAQTLTLSQAPSVPSGATITQPGASLMVGYPPVGLPYPPPSGAYQAMIRYQRLMPPMTQAQVNGGAYFWFDDDMAVVEGLAGLLMRYSGDDRAVEYIGDGLQVGEAGGRFGKRMAQYARVADDRSNRAQSVQLDRRNFGHNFSTLQNTKKVGW